MSNYGKLEGRITIPSGGLAAMKCTDDLGGPTQVTITAGDYYWSSPDSGANTLIEQIAADINAVMGKAWVLIPSVSEGGTGRINIGIVGALGEVTWDVVAFRNLLGFDADLSGATAYDSPGQSLGLWLPDGPPTTPFALEDGWDESDSSYLESTAGHVSGLHYQRKTVNELAWAGLSAKKTRIYDEVLLGQSFQRFYRDVIRSENTYCFGTPIRWYKDADTSAEYVTIRVSGLKEFKPEPMRSPSRVRWQLSMGRVVVVP